MQGITGDQLIDFLHEFDDLHSEAVATFSLLVALDVQHVIDPAAFFRLGMFFASVDIMKRGYPQWSENDEDVCTSSASASAS